MWWWKKHPALSAKSPDPVVGGSEASQATSTTDVGVTVRAGLIDGLVGGDEHSRRRSRRELSAALGQVLVSADNPGPLKVELERFCKAGWELIGHAEYGEGEYTLAAAIETLTQATRFRSQLKDWLPLFVTPRLHTFLNAPVADLNMPAWSALTNAIGHAVELNPVVRAPRLDADANAGSNAAGASAGVTVSPGKLSPLIERISLLNSTLELGFCDDSILSEIFSKLKSTPNTILPAAMPKLGHTAFLLWKGGWGDAAKRLLFTCLAWALGNSSDPEEISWLIGNIRYVYEKDGRPISDEDIREVAKAYE
jgi:hypothetical protein